MLQLVTNNMDIVEDEHVIDASFDLVVDFNTTVNLAPETIENVTEDVDFESDVGAYKCVGGNGDGDPFATDTTPLAPNQELAVCITSQNDNVKLETLTNMVSTYLKGSLHLTHCHLLTFDFAGHLLLTDHCARRRRPCPSGGRWQYRG